MARSDAATAARALRSALSCCLASCRSRALSSAVAACGSAALSAMGKQCTTVLKLVRLLTTYAAKGHMHQELRQLVKTQSCSTITSAPIPPAPNAGWYLEWSLTTSLLMITYALLNVLCDSLFSSQESSYAEVSCTSAPCLAHQ